MKYKSGYFSEGGEEYHITDPAQKRAFDNFIWNDSVFSNVEHTGVGYMDYQIGSLEGIKLFTGIGRVCDFDVFGRDGLMSRLVYLRDNDTGEIWNLNWEPALANYEHFDCSHGLGYTIITNSTNGIKCVFRIFVPPGEDPVELWTLALENVSNDTARNISVFSYSQMSFKYKWGFNSYGDMIFRNSIYDRELCGMIASKHPHIRPHEYLTGFVVAEPAPDGYDGCKDKFAGRYNTLDRPEAVLNGKCTGSAGSSDATIAALQFNIQLKPCEIRRIDFVVGASDSREGVAELKRKYITDSDRCFESRKAANAAFIESNRFKTPDEHLDRLINIWCKHQTAYGAKWCRWGWNGYRDIVQHAMGVVSFNPGRTREILMEAMAHKNSNGLALRGWNPVDEKEYSDSALWLAFTLTDYLKETGDTDFLDVRVPYYDKGSDTILGHIENSLNFLQKNRGAHDLCLIKFGDWNDSLTGVGAAGRGESVWLSMAYAYALGLMVELFEHLSDSGKVREYQERRKDMLDAINANAWDGEWYLRCYDDNGRPLGSSSNEQGKIFVNTQSWAMICGAADIARRDAMLKSCDKLLLTPMGYQLLAPTFTKFDPNIGRISNLEPGICENGTIYSHGNAFMFWGLLKAGLPDKAYEVFRMISPGYVDSEDDPKQNCLPYVYSNCYYGPDHRNNPLQMEFSWITGSAPWFYTAITRLMLGVKPSYMGLSVEPLLPSSWSQKIEMSRRFRGKDYKICITPVPGSNPAVDISSQ